jgi:hypothetical protein
MAWLQARSESGMLGRVMALMMFAVSVLEPLSHALAGVMADWNLTTLFVISGSIMLVASLLSLGTRAIRADD